MAEPEEPDNRAKFLLQEHAALRAEILLRTTEVYSLERNVVITTAAIWAFLATHRVSEGEKWAWASPILFTLLGCLRAISDNKIFGRFNKYIKEIERHFLGAEGGWEAFIVRDRQRYSWIRRKLLFWLILFVSTILMAFYEIFWFVEKLSFSN